ncbi:MAG: hypothetical protein B6229_07940 [Spirochaetaceae bacterium 4572_7]|nr:MAG: hypothetical protein B6229_07940 [Spirochaetaceae bacterium 4572_7]
MDIITGIITTNSLTIKLSQKYYLLEFHLQIDSSILIHGDIIVHFKTSKPMDLKIGEKALVKGKIIINSGFIINATAIIKQPI